MQGAENAAKKKRNWPSVGNKPPLKETFSTPIGHDGKPMLRRRGASQLLGKSWDQIRNLQEKGLLHSNVFNGVHFFVRQDVLRLAARHDARVAEALELFSQGKSALEVIIELNMEPARARHLHEEFHATSARIVLQLPPKHTLEAWCSVYGVRPEDVDPRMLLAALEICLASPELRALAQANVRRASAEPVTTTTLP